MKEENKLELDLNQILVDVIKLDRGLQDSIKSRVKERIIDDITEKFLQEYYSTKWNSDKQELSEEVMKKLTEDRESFVKRILADFTEKLNYFSRDKRVKAYEEFKASVEKLTNYKNI